MTAKDGFLKEYLDLLVKDVRYLKETQDEMRDGFKDLETKVELLSEALQGGDEKKKGRALLKIYMRSSLVQQLPVAH